MPFFGPTVDSLGSKQMTRRKMRRHAEGRVEEEMSSWPSLEKQPALSALQLRFVSFHTRNALADPQGSLTLVPWGVGFESRANGAPRVPAP